ncbi:MAG: hypothetical protein E6J74_41400, partial [Deltaproteobacteria bacterium]
MRVKMILPTLTEAVSPFFRPIKYSLFPPLGLAAGLLLGTLLSVTTLAVRADDWPGPQTKEVFSASREY